MLHITTIILSLLTLQLSLAFVPVAPDCRGISSLMSLDATTRAYEPAVMKGDTALPNRRDALTTLVSTMTVLIPTTAVAKCTDIDSCREIGEAKDQQDSLNNPVKRLANGVSYKVLIPGVASSSEIVSSTSSVDIAFSVSQANGRYMFSKGFGLEKVPFMGAMVPDRNIESLRVDFGRKNVPQGIEQVLLGMKRGEKRRVVLPPQVGFATSDWQPRPMKRDAQRQLNVYRQQLAGAGGQPPFPAPTIWDVEVLRIRT